MSEEEQSSPKVSSVGMPNALLTRRMLRQVIYEGIITAAKIRLRCSVAQHLVVGFMVPNHLLLRLYILCKW